MTMQERDGSGFARLLGPTIAAGLLGIAAPAGAQCFCLAHPVTGLVVHYGCEAKQIPNRVSKRVTCLNDMRTGRAAITDSVTLTHIPDGEGACNPCAPPPDSVLPDFPRRPDEIAPTTSQEGVPPHD